MRGAGQRPWEGADKVSCGRRGVAGRMEGEVPAAFTVRAGKRHSLGGGRSSRVDGSLGTDVGQAEEPDRQRGLGRGGGLGNPCAHSSHQLMKAFLEGSDRSRWS